MIRETRSISRFWQNVLSCLGDSNELGAGEVSTKLAVVEGGGLETQNRLVKLVCLGFLGVLGVPSISRIPPSSTLTTDSLSGSLFISPRNEQTLEARANIASNPLHVSNKLTQTRTWNPSRKPKLDSQTWLETLASNSQPGISRTPNLILEVDWNPLHVSNKLPQTRTWNPSGQPKTTPKLDSRSCLETLALDHSDVFETRDSTSRTTRLSVTQK